MPVTVKRATIEDLERLVPLFGAYRVFYKQSRNNEAERSFLHERMVRRESVILLAAAGDRGNGFTQLYPMFSSVRMRRVWILNDLFVEAGTRNSGVGEALLRAAADFAREDGAAGLELATQQDNVAAKRLYEKLGWKRDTEFDHYYLHV